MNVISRNISSASTLNPNAPMFVPSAYRAVEDFSDQWWALVESSPWFRDYWLQECFSDSQIYDPVLPEIDAFFDAYDVEVQSHTVKGESNARVYGPEPRNFFLTHFFDLICL